MVSIVRTYNKTRILNEIEQNGNYVLAKIEYDLRNALTISPALQNCSTATSSNLTITQRDAANNTITIDYRLSNTPESGIGSCSSNCTFAVQRSTDQTNFYSMINSNLKEGVQIVQASTPLPGFCLISSDPQTIRIHFDLVQAPSSPGGKANQATQAFERIVVTRFID